MLLCRLGAAMLRDHQWSFEVGVIVRREMDVVRSDTAAVGDGEGARSAVYIEFVGHAATRGALGWGHGG